MAAAFVLPWIIRAEPGGRLLARYAPVSAGGARLNAEYDAAGALTAWASQNDILLPTGLALAAEMRPSERDAIRKFFERAGETNLPMSELITRMADAQVYHSRVRRLRADGTTSDSIVLSIRHSGGDSLVGFYDPNADVETVFDPPMLVFDATLTPGRTWESSGKSVSNQNALDYRYSGRVIEKAQCKTETAQVDDCLKVETRLVLSRAGEVLYDLIDRYSLAPGLGAISSDSSDAKTGQLRNRTIMFSATDSRLGSPSLPTPPSASKNPSPNDAARWEMTRFASMRTSSDNSECTIPPTWIPTEPPLLLAARYGSGLSAFNANEPNESPVWRFQPGATIYGPPAFDANTGRIFFGASDKRLYALDARGLFLWSFQTGDNIVTRPLVAGKTVIFASEDRFVYCLNGATGKEAWRRRKVGAAVVSSPVFADGMAIFGCDDGTVYGFDVTTGEQRLRVPLNAPIEAPIAAADGRVFAATQDGMLYAIDPKTQRQIWSTTAAGKVRSAPVIAGGRVFVVAESGRLSGYDIPSGRRLFLSTETDYTGPPAVLPDQLIVATQNGDAFAISFDGQRGQTFRRPHSSDASQDGGALRLGATFGGGAVWLADSKSVIHRLGPPIAGAAPLQTSWSLSFSQPPFTKHFLTVTPVAYKQQAIVVDNECDIFLLDPATGKGSRLGNLGGSFAATDPAVVNDTLLAVAGTTTTAVELPGGTVRWKFDARAGGAMPVTIAGDVALWLTQQSSTDASGKAGDPSGVMHALDLATGAVRWQRPLTKFVGVGEAFVRGDTIYTSAPTAAFVLATGEPRWQAELDGLPLGGGALNESGDTIFVGLTKPNGTAAAIAAVRTTDGTMLWQHDIGSSPLHPFERPALSGNVLVVPLWSGEIIGIGSADGGEIWRHKPRKPRYGAIQVADGHVWFAENNSRVVALDAQNGRVAAHLSRDIDIGSIASLAGHPVVIGNRVLVSLGIALIGIELPPPPEERRQP